MTKIIARVLLITYLALLLRPYMPFVMNFLAHTFWRARHMATVHYENGQFHVHAEYIDAVRKTAPEQSSHSPHSMVAMADHLTRTFFYTFDPPARKRVFRAAAHASLPIPFCGVIYPPPRSGLF